MTHRLKKLTTGRWAEATVDFTDSRRGDTSPKRKRADTAAGKPRRGDRVDEIHFLLPRGVELLIDDVLLYEPGGS
jgi:hypothetical protein